MNKYEYIKEIICPHCGYEMQYEIGPREETTDMACEECDIIFMVIRCISTTYITEKPAAGEQEGEDEDKKINNWRCS